MKWRLIMQREVLARSWALATLMLVVSWFPAFADTPGTCNYAPGTYCTSSNTCGNGSGTTCQVQIVRANLANGTVSPVINGTATALAAFCIPAGTSVTWITSDATSFTDIRFSSTYPFGKSSFGSDSMNSITNTVSNSGSGTSCYTFSVSNCTYAGTTCNNSDPKVVIQGGSPLTHHHPHPHPSTQDSAKPSN
jgi:surface antigen